MKPSREHADDFERLSFEYDLATDDGRVASEHSLPGTVADQDDARREHRVLARNEQPPENRLDAKRFEESFRDSGTDDRLRFGAIEIVEALRACCCDVAEGLRSVVPIEKRAGRDPCMSLAF